MSFTFLQAVNECLILEGIISGDDDELSSFTDTQHVISSKLAQKAIQQELASLVSEQIIDAERTSALLTTTPGTRTYTLASGFIRFRTTARNPNVVLWEATSAGITDGQFVQEWPGGEESIITAYPRYLDQQARPIYWYWVGGGTQDVGLYPVPDGTRYYKYFYEKDVTVTTAADTLPFAVDTQARTFIRGAARRFKFLRSSPVERETFYPKGLEDDEQLKSNRAVLMSLLRHKQPPSHYGRRYA